MSNLYALHDPDGERISFGEDEDQLWLEEVRKHFQETQNNHAPPNDFHCLCAETREHVEAINKLRKQGFTTHEYRKVEP